MIKVLVAEDEQDAREHIANILARDGQEVQVAATGREAIDIGSYFRPDVLVADWMLKNHINGLHVSKVLQAVNENLRTILISGVPSKMFSAQLFASDVYSFFEKPLEIEPLLESVKGAVVAPRSEQAEPAVPVPGVVEMTSTGDILYRNERATELFGKAAPGKHIANMGEIVSPAEVAALSHDRMTRVQMGYPTGETDHWRFCVKRLDEGRNKLVVLLPEADARGIDLTTLRMLLGFPEPWRFAWPLQGTTIIVDPDPASRRLILAQMRRARAKHLGVSSVSEALQVLTDEPRVDLVIVDHAVGVDAIQGLLTLLAARHKDARVIGISDSDANDHPLRALGVGTTLRKPWGVCDLLDIVTSRL